MNLFTTTIAFAIFIATTAALKFISQVGEKYWKPSLMFTYYVYVYVLRATCYGYRWDCTLRHILAYNVRLRAFLAFSLKNAVCNVIRILLACSEEICKNVFFLFAISFAKPQIELQILERRKGKKKA